MFSVYVLPVFEVAKNKDLPNSKSELLKMLKNKEAFWFHEKICPHCHRIPNSKEWLQDQNLDELSVAVSVKRTGNFHHWEPIHIGTNADPWYDERLSWEGRSDKMTHAYILCLMNYSFNILSNSFLGKHF